MCKVISSNCYYYQKRKKRKTVRLGIPRIQGAFSGKVTSDIEGCFTDEPVVECDFQYIQMINA